MNCNKPGHPYIPLPESIILNIFSFAPSFEFYKRCKDLLAYDARDIISLVGKYYFIYPQQSSQIPQTDQSQITTPTTIVRSYLFLDYFLYHKHLLVLDDYDDFECYLRENRWACDASPKNTIVTESLRNIMRLSYFVNCLREVGRHQRQMTNDKIEQSNIGISFQCLIESINKESEDQTSMLRNYIGHL